MLVTIVADAQAIGAHAARLIARRVAAGPCVLGLATGSSPEGTYQELIRMHREEGLSFSQVSAYTLDEYVGLPGTHEQSYAQTIRRIFTDHVDIAPDQLTTPRGDSDNPVAEAARYDAAVRAAGVDVQILGIGSNGHIAFNEPASSFASRTRVQPLTAQTIADNARFFETADEVPKRCITQGLNTIMQAKACVLVANGAGKADAIARAIEGPQAANCPASILQSHPNVTFVLDEAAASKLGAREYYAAKSALAQELAEG